jgi:hypothetical protein
MAINDVTSFNFFMLVIFYDESFTPTPPKSLSTLLFIFQYFDKIQKLALKTFKPRLFDTR